MTTLSDLLAHRVATDPLGLAWRAREPSGWVDHHWADVDRAVQARAATLIRSGLQPGDRVAVAGPTSAAWLVTAFAIWRAGGVLVTVYPTVPDDEADYILHDSGAVYAYAASGAWRTRWSHTLGADRVRDLIAADDPHPTDPVPRAGDDLAALVYTSGTTGRPKGVMLRHRGFVDVCRAVAAHTPNEPDDIQYLFLPLAHVYGLIVALAAVHVGAPSVIDGDTERIAEGLATTHPTFLPAVPRVFEKVLERAEGRARDRSPVAHAIFRWSVRVALTWSQTVQGGSTPSRGLALQLAIADRLVYRKVRAALGGRLRAVASGGAPLAPEVAALFHAVGIPVLEGYGLTETTAIATASRLDAWRIGAVGLPEDGVDLRIADDDEVLVRGPNVFAGYWNLPEATAEALSDGWLHTGDLGRIDADGFLHITGRKKDLIVTAGGKNIAPAKIENRLKAASPLIGEALVHGDKRAYCVALLALDPEALEGWRRSQTTPDDALHAELQAAVDTVNATLGSFESIKRFHVLERMPTVENGELTPSLKLKRRVLEQRYADALDTLYRGERHPPQR